MGESGLKVDVYFSLWLGEVFKYVTFKCEGDQLNITYYMKKN
jgi:hypothetical protein